MSVATKTALRNDQIRCQYLGRRSALAMLGLAAAALPVAACGGGTRSVRGSACGDQDASDVAGAARDRDPTDPQSCPPRSCSDSDPNDPTGRGRHC